MKRALSIGGRMIRASLAVGQIVHRRPGDPAIEGAWECWMEELEGRLPDGARTVDMIATEVSRAPALGNVKWEEVRKAVSDLAAASQGSLVLTESEEVNMLSSVGEIRRRLADMTRSVARPRRASKFRKDLATDTPGSEDH